MREICPACGRSIAFLTMAPGRFRRHVVVPGVVCDGAWRTVEEAQAAKDRVALMRYGATWSTSSSGGYVGVVPATFTPLSPEIVGTEHGEMDA